MSTAERDALEASVRGACESGDHDAAATGAIKGYGPEIYGFLVGVHQDEQGAADVFSIVCESVWRGLPKFAWGSTLRTWMYTVARHASLRYRQTARRHARGVVPLSGHASALAAEVRTATQPFLRTEQKDAFARLRASLSPEDQILLVLRVDRELAWDDLARVTLGGDENRAEATDVGRELPDLGVADEATLKREAARLRKRFQLVKERLLALGREQGLVDREK